MKDFIKRSKKNKLIDEIVEDYTEPKSAITANAYNEKILDKTIKKVIAHNKAKLIKPINTRVLIKQ